VRLYGALLALYPEAFRRRYEAEMRRDFRELMLEGLQEGGAKELVRLWAQAHSDLVLTALKERGTTAARRYAPYSAVDPRIARRAAARAMGAVVLVALGVTSVSLQQAPIYEASAQVWVAQGQWDGQPRPIPKRFITPQHVAQMEGATHSRPVAEEAIRRLELDTSPDELLGNLTVEQIESTSFIVLTYEDTDPARAQAIANTVGNVSSELVSERGARSPGSNLTASVYEEAIVPESPVSPDPLRDGLLTLVMGLVLCVGLVVARPSLAASVAGKLGRPADLRVVGQAGILAGPSVAEDTKENELLEALGRRGKLTAVEAALGTSLSEVEAEQMLDALAVKGHLQVTVEHGTLHYALWEHDAPYEGL
jgi:capsular polysaccharide biosynthesis protein